MAAARASACSAVLEQMLHEARSIWCHPKITELILVVILIIEFQAAGSGDWPPRSASRLHGGGKILDGRARLPGLDLLLLPCKRVCTHTSLSLHAIVLV